MLLDTLILLIYYNRNNVKNLFMELGGFYKCPKQVLSYMVQCYLCQLCERTLIKDTYEWLQAILGRKYNHIDFEFTYIDFMKQTENLTDRDRQFIERIKKMNFLSACYNQ